MAPPVLAHAAALGPYWPRNTFVILAPRPIPEHSPITRKLKVTAIGDSTGVILPREILDKLRVDRGDELMVLESPDGITQMPCDPTLAEQMEVAEKIIRRRRNLLNQLAE